VKTLTAAAAAVIAALLGGCGPDVHEKPSKAPPCPVPPEPAHQSVVVGTIGKLHMVESRYALARFGDVFAAFKPDLVLVGVRVDAFRADHLEDASFEMTYVQHLAKARGVPIEPIDWFREADLTAPPAPLDPFDVTEIEKREAELLRAPRLYTFEQANSDELLEKMLLATSAAARYRGGDPLSARRRAWIHHLTIDAASRHNKPKRVLAFVDVLDRPQVDLVLHGVGYESRRPVDVVAKSKEVLAGGADIPAEVLASYRAQLARAKEHVAKATSGSAERTFWEDRAHVLEVVVDRKAACCVTQSMLAAAPSK
jgi:hypothetical protein